MPNGVHFFKVAQLNNISFNLCHKLVKYHIEETCLIGT